MFQSRLTRNISANTLQLITNQLFGLAIFYALSRGLDKNSFGLINWSLAVLLTVFGILTFGIDQVMVKKIAAGNDKHAVFSGYSYHVIIFGCLFYCLLLVAYWLVPQPVLQPYFLLIIGLGKLFIFLSTPFKQLATGLEQFSKLFTMSVVSNIVRGTALLILLVLGNITVGNVLIIFVTGDLVELLVCLMIAKPLLQNSYKIKWNRQAHLLLIKESLPQTGVVIFTAIMARFDWIMIGLIISGARLAEYSFAWKIFEISTLPLLIVAPIMIPLFTRLFKENASNKEPVFFLEWQIVIASFVALLLNICWVPVVDFISDGKYGAVNAQTIFILSLSMPVLYFNNYLWTINFARGNLKLVFKIMTIAFVVNIISCSILIPLYANTGAAFANLITVVVQLSLYLFKTPFALNTAQCLRLIICPAIALIAGAAVQHFITNIFFEVLFVAGIYLLAVFMSGQVRIKDWRTLQSLYQ